MYAVFEELEEVLKEQFPSPSFETTVTWTSCWGWFMNFRASVRWNAPVVAAVTT